MITALLLAAGSSRRFGAPKLLEQWNDKPIVRWCAELLQGAPVDEIVVVVPPEHDDIRRALAGIDARFVVNPQRERGMGTSLACGVAALAADTEAAVVVLADEPTLGRSALERVIERYRAGGAAIVASTYRGVRGHPVLFDRGVFAELGELSGDHGARAIVDRDTSRVALIEMNEAKPMDVDTRADLDRLRGTAAAQRPLIDELMGQFDVRAAYATDVRAPEQVVYRALMETDLLRSFIGRTLFSIRMLGRTKLETFRLADLPARGPFFLLDSDPPREVVIGILGSFWRLAGNVHEGDREAFQAPLPAGTAKAAWNFRVQPGATGSRLTTETRVLCADAESRRQFRRYWTFIGPFSGLIRMEALRLIRQQAQNMSSPFPTPP